jgi:tetratricopeptide (TPR) repeat protein
VRQWWEAFWKPAPRRPIDQDEASLHLMHAELLRRSAPRRHLTAWEGSQTAGLVAAAGGWVGPAGGLLDAYLRLTMLQPQLPRSQSGLDALPGPDQAAHALQSQFALQRDDTSPALLYLAVRAARRALAANPHDAQASLVLGESYLRLLHATRERAWGKQMPELVQLRRVQASAALNRAVALDPNLIQPHYSLGVLYQETGFLDLALHHLRTYHELAQKAGIRPEVDDELLSRLAREVQKREDACEVATAGWKVLDRALKAQQMGLGGKARNLMLESNVAAFGSRGVGLELELLLKTGRPEDVLEWIGPEHKAALGASWFWLRAQALAASGDYALAQEECNQLTRFLAAGPGGAGSLPIRGVMALLTARRVLAEQPGTRSPFALLRQATDRPEFHGRLANLAQRLKREANMTVFRGLLALEEGEVEEAEIAFRQALTLWKDSPTAASGGGLDFNGRAIAQGCLEWLGPG